MNIVQTRGRSIKHNTSKPLFDLQPLRISRGRTDQAMPSTQAKYQHEAAGTLLLSAWNLAFTRGWIILVPCHLHDRLFHYLPHDAMKCLKVPYRCLGAARDLGVS